MDITRAFTFSFDDEEWVNKLVLIVIWTFIAAIPIIGLVGVAALAGYMVEMLRNMRRDQLNPLPRWDNLGDKFSHGFNVLIASLVYNIPNLLLGCGFLFLVPSLGVGDSQSTTTASSAALAITCCLTVIVFGYNIIIWPLIALGTIRYAESRQITAYFQVSDLWATINRHLGQTIQWIIFSFFASLVLGALNAIPCVGWLASLALTVPVQGHLLGQFARDLEKPKGKPKRT